MRLEGFASGAARCWQERNGDDRAGQWKYAASLGAFYEADEGRVKESSDG
ncbi:MAG: hypothetical protein LBU65_11775 [Planctomycetaceae bacterium]|jgi:hypothetical protein|nr:hypothetical protein [Planctomycetaceae bacterium]